MKYKVDIQEYTLSMSPFPVAALKSVQVLNCDSFEECELRLTQLKFTKTGEFISDSLGRKIHCWTRARFGFVDFAQAFPPVTESGLILVS